MIKGAKIYIKNEALNPTGSFKDRGTTTAIQKVFSLGLKRVGTVSTGNMAASTAAFGAKSGISTFILVKGDTPQGKLISASIHNPILLRVRGDYGDLSKKSYSIGEENNICFMNSVHPLRIEGYKVTGFEIFEQLDRKVPAYIFVPMSSGGHIVGLMRSFLDLKKENIISQFPTFVGVQAQNCAPISQAFQAGASMVTRIIESKTIAQAISNPAPPGGNIVLKLIRENSGLIIDVSDKEILHAQKMLAESEGIFCQPASATSLAGCLKLSKELGFKKEDQIILLITGSGLKSLDTCDPNKLNTYDIDINELEESFRSILNKRF
jgi:threonine synthase